MRPLSRFSLLAAVGGLFVLGSALTSCAPDTSAPELQPRAEPTEQEMAQPTATVAQAPTLSPQELEATLQAVALANTGCLDCHTDEEQLRALAVEEEVVELSEGPG